MNDLKGYKGGPLEVTVNLIPSVVPIYLSSLVAGIVLTSASVYAWKTIGSNFQSGPLCVGNWRFMGLGFRV